MQWLSIHSIVPDDYSLDSIHEVLPEKKTTEEIHMRFSVTRFSIDSQSTLNRKNGEDIDRLVPSRKRLKSLGDLKMEKNFELEKLWKLGIMV